VTPHGARRIDEVDPGWALHYSARGIIITHGRAAQFHARAERADVASSPLFVANYLRGARVIGRWQIVYARAKPAAFVSQLVSLAQVELNSTCAPRGTDPVMTEAEGLTEASAPVADADEGTDVALLALPAMPTRDPCRDR
jgi:hypothetical protein